VLSKDEIQKLAEKTKQIREARRDPALFEKRERRKREKERSRRERDEYDSEDSADEFSREKPVRMLEAAPTGQAQGVPGVAEDGAADFVRERERRRDRERERERERDRDRERERETVPRERERDRDRERERDRDRDDRAYAGGGL